jgi:rsbT antagonist protein RsbS
VTVPILKQGKVLIASIQEALSDEDLIQLRDDISERIGRFRIRGLVIDVTAMDVMDSFATKTIRNIAISARIRGAETVIVGIQPDVAFAMVRLGLTFDLVQTELDLEAGLEHLRERASSHGGRHA